MHTAERKLLMLKPTDIIVPPTQPRKSFDEYELKLLADSIGSIGIVQPLTVRKNGKGFYELVSGERRLRAARLAGLRRVPCILHRTDETCAAMYAITENLQRHELHFFEEAAALERLTSVYGVSQTEVSARLGISQAVLCNRLRLLRLDENLKERIIKTGLSEKHAMLLLRLPEEKRSDFLERTVSEGLTVSGAQQLVNEILCPTAVCGVSEESAEPPYKDEPVRKAAIGDMRLFDNSLEKLLDTLRGIGIKAGTQRRETDSYIEYRVRIKKENPASCQQLKIC